MSKTLNRLLWAALTSASCFGATFYWYHSTKPTLVLNSKTGTQVAQIVESTNQVAKRPLRRLVWQSLGTGDPLFNGETIKTSENSDAHIQFTESQSLLHIEPNSLIVLEQKNDEIQLDLLKGGLFVRSEKKTPSAIEKPRKALSIKTEAGKIKLTGVEASLSKTKGKAVNLQVLKGQAKVNINGRETTIKQGKSGKFEGKTVKLTESSIEILSPKHLQAVHLNPEKPKPVKLKFKPIQKSWPIHLELGASRTSMRRLKNLSAKASSGLMTARLKVGKYYWKLVALSPDGKVMTESPVQILPVEARFPPSITSPAANHQFEIEKLPHDVSFQWSGTQSYDSIRLQIASDRRLSQMVHQEWSDRSILSLPIKKEGTYYWRVIGYKNKKPFSSKVQRFHLHQLSPVAPPELSLPRNLAEIQHGSKTPVKLSWQQIIGAAGYEIQLNVVLQSGKVMKKNYKRKKNFLVIPRAPRGSYSWRVTTLSPDLRRSRASDPFSFKVLGMPELPWLGEQKDFEYVTPQPSARLAWELGPEGTKQYRLRTAITRDELRSGNPITQTDALIETDVTQKFPNDGVYFLMIEALGKSGNLLAQSKIRQIRVYPKPLLQAPVLQPRISGVLKADRRGDFDLNWTSIEGAKGYTVEVKSTSSSKQSTYEYNGPTGSLKSLSPGSYEVRVHAKDSFGRRSPASATRKLLVPKEGVIRPPSLNKIEVN